MSLRLYCNSEAHASELQYSLKDLFLESYAVLSKMDIYVVTAKCHDLFNYVWSLHGMERDSLFPYDKRLFTCRIYVCLNHITVNI